MAGKFETIESFAKEMEAEGHLQAVFRPSTYRGQEVNKVVEVFFDDINYLKKKKELIELALEGAKKDVEYGAFGAKKRVTYLEWKREFIVDILQCRIPCSLKKDIPKPVTVDPDKDLVEGQAGGEPVECSEPSGSESEGAPVLFLRPIEEPVQTIEPAQAAEQSTPAESAESIGEALGMIIKTVAQAFSETQGKALTESVKEAAIEAAQQFIEETYGPIEKKVNIETPQGNKIQVEGVLHEKFDEVLAFVQADEPVFLCGPAGCGKNVLVKQVAEALGLDFYFSNAVTQEYKITGFTDAMGTFQESQFYKAFKDGGVFFLDEMDGSIPEVLIILNAAIANRYFDFPAPIGRIEAHPDFRIVAAGNTFGQGASLEYVGRTQLDAASLDRFAFIDMDYDERIEMYCAQDNEALVDFIHDTRKAADRAGIPFIVSYRTITRMTKMIPVLGLKRAIQTCLLKGMDNADIRSLCTGMTDNSEYRDAVYDCIQ